MCGELFMCKYGFLLAARASPSVSIYGSKDSCVSILVCHSSGADEWREALNALFLH